MTREHQIRYALTTDGYHIAYAFRFEDRGPHELRGVPGSWTLYEVMN